MSRRPSGRRLASSVTDDFQRRLEKRSGGIVVHAVVDDVIADALNRLRVGSAATQFDCEQLKLLKRHEQDVGFGFLAETIFRIFIHLPAKGDVLSEVHWGAHSG